MNLASMNSKEMKFKDIPIDESEIFEGEDDYDEEYD